MEGPTALVVILALLIALVAVGGLAGTRVMAELRDLIGIIRARPVDSKRSAVARNDDEGATQAQA